MKEIHKNHSEHLNIRAMANHRPMQIQGRKTWLDKKHLGHVTDCDPCMWRLQWSLSVLTMHLFLNIKLPEKLAFLKTVSIFKFTYFYLETTLNHAQGVLLSLSSVIIPRGFRETYEVLVSNPGQPGARQASTCCTISHATQTANIYHCTDSD